MLSLEKNVNGLNEEFQTRQFEFFSPIHLSFGCRSISKLPDKIKHLGKRCMLFTMPELQEAGIVDDVLSIIEPAGMEVQVCTNIEPDPTCSHIDALIQEYKVFRPDFVIGLGGGSVMDLAKSFSIGILNESPIWSFVNLPGRPGKPITNGVLPIVAIPTTAGTGAEMTPYAVITNLETKQKATIMEYDIYPKHSIVDPELTTSLPPFVTGCTAFDAFAHAFESYISASNRSLFTEMLTLESMSQNFHALDKVLADPKDVNARASMAWSALLAGIAISHTATGIPHTMGQSFGARVKIPHAASVSLFTLPIVKRTFSSDVEKFEKLANFLAPGEVSSLSSLKKAEKVIDLIESYLTKVGLIQKMRDYECPSDIVDLLLSDIYTYGSRSLERNPKKFEKHEIREILKEAF